MLLVQAGEVLAKPLSFFAKRRFQERYGAALVLYADGEDQRALDAMVSLEREFVSGDYALREAIRKLEVSYALRLAKRSLEALEAVTLLHEALYRRYREQGEPAAAGHARETMVALALEYSDMDSDAAKTARMADLVSRQGKEMLASHAETMAISLFERALALDPDEINSRLCLAWIYEKRGRYETALDVLRDLVQVDPGHREGLLRLAIQWTRQGRDLEASSLLDALTPAGPSDWILALAVQERARLLADSGELESALSLVTATEERMPCDSSLAVLDAYLGERSGSGRRAVDLDERLRHCAGSSHASPRNLYNRLPKGCEPSPASEENVHRSRLSLQAALQSIR